MSLSQFPSFHLFLSDSAKLAVLLKGRTLVCVRVQRRQTDSERASTTSCSRFNASSGSCLSIWIQSDCRERDSLVWSEDGARDRDSDHDAMLVDGTRGTVALAVGGDASDQVVDVVHLLVGEDFVRITDVGGGSLDATVLRHQDGVRVLLQRLWRGSSSGRSVASRCVPASALAYPHGGKAFPPDFRAVLSSALASR